MKNLFVKLSALFMVTIIEIIGCKKDQKNEPEQFSAVKYVDFQRQLVSEHHALNVDLDQDGRSDFLFRVHQVAYNNNTESRMEFRLYSTGSGKIAIDTTNESTPILAKGVAIDPRDFSAFQWLSANKTILMEKSTIDLQSRWIGGLINQLRGYLPVKVIRDSKSYCGWIELEADIHNDRLFLLRGGVALETEKSIQAGL